MIIYCTTNLITGRKYIGQDSYNDSSYLGSGKYLKRAVEKYGRENFKKQTLQDCIDLNDLNESEIHWIDYFNAVESDLFYNLVLGGKGTRGRKVSEELRRNHSETMKGRPAWNKGVAATEEQKRKQSVAMMGKPAPNKGVPMSEEQKEIFTKTSFKKGFILSPGHKEKLRIANSNRVHAKGHKLSEEHKRKISEGLKKNNI